MEKKENLIKNLKNNCFCRLGQSKIHGVGVLATKDIPKGVKIFQLCNGETDQDILDLEEEDLRGLNEGTTDYIKSFMIKNEDGYPVPEKGLNSINISFFLNHSHTPNVIHEINLIKRDT
jgi:SET domain-containing protein